MNDFRRPNDPAQEFINQIKRNFRGQGGSGGPNLLWIAGGILLAITIFGSFYTVEPDEEAVVLRFGAYVKTSPPGLHLKLPFFIDQVKKLRTKEVKQEEFGFRTKDTSGRRTSYVTRGFAKESSMLTGDLNVAEVTWVVQYKISDPRKYLFNVKEAQRTLRDISEAVMRRVVGDRLVNNVLTTGRSGIAIEAERLAQEIINQYDIGITVEGVKLQDIDPPAPVQDSFNEVNAAKQEQEALINQAEKRYNSVIPAARGKAEQMISEAQGYAAAVVNRARGDASRFEQTLSAYRTAPDVTRRRIYIETMEDLLKNFEKVTVVDNDIKGLLPVFQGNPNQSAK